MTAAVETMAYTGQVPWHGLGETWEGNLPPKDVLVKAGLDWTVSKREVFFDKAGAGMTKVDNSYALVRDTDQAVLSMVGSSYKPVQNEEAMDFFSKFVAAGDMTMETAGSLWGGRYVWGLAKLSKNFTLAKKDEVKGFLLLSSPHVFGYSMLFQFTPIRVVCWNTLTYAIGSNLKGKPGAFRMPHSTKFDDTTKEKALEALGLANNQMEEFKEAATLLSKKKADPEMVTEYFHEILKYDPSKATKNQDGSVREPRLLGKFQKALEFAPGQQLSTAAGTWWGAVNAVTYVIDHDVGRSRDTALRDAWMGYRATTKRDAVRIALEKAK